jgi:hypothetical protein
VEQASWQVEEMRLHSIIKQLGHEQGIEEAMNMFESTIQRYLLL